MGKTSAMRIVTLITLVSVLASYTWAEENIESFENVRPENKEECLSRGGKWVYFEFGLFYFCALNTTDTGKICSDNNQCQGDCLPINELAESGENSQGQCAATYPMPGGCPKYLIKGKVVTEPCI